MRKLIGEVVPATSGAHPFKAIISRDGYVIMTWPVMSKQAGEARIRKLLAEVLDPIEPDDGETV